MSVICKAHWSALIWELEGHSKCRSTVLGSPRSHVCPPNRGIFDDFKDDWTTWIGPFNFKELLSGAPLLKNQSQIDYLKNSKLRPNFFSSSANELHCLPDYSCCTTHQCCIPSNTPFNPCSCNMRGRCAPCTFYIKTGTITFVCRAKGSTLPNPNLICRICFIFSKQNLFLPSLFLSGTTAQWWSWSQLFRTLFCSLIKWSSSDLPAEDTESWDRHWCIL